MKSSPNVQKSVQSRQTDVVVSSDSDCEIMEPHISVIDLNDSVEEEAMAEEEDVAIIEDEKEVVEIDEDEAPLSGAEDDEPQGGEDSVIPLDESSCVRTPSPPVDHVLAVTFSDREKYYLLRDYVKVAVKKCLEARNIFTEANDEEDILTVSFAEKPIEENDEGADLIFAIDTTPASKPEISAIPSYRRSIREVFNDQKRKEFNEDECTKLKRMSMCFNCSGSHALKDCTEPKNHQRISKAKKQFGVKTERYHVDIEQRYGHIKPGRISENLRRAMGLKGWELPSFIYNMRLLGYPPGWLEEAKVSHSGIVLFDSEGRQVQGSDDEGGEFAEEKHKYDVRKIISFPGFNCAVEDGIVEDRYKPPRLSEDEKDNFINSLGDNIVKGYKRKKLKNLQALDSDKSQEPAEAIDMEIEPDADFSPAPLPATLPLPLPATVPLPHAPIPYQPLFSIPPPPIIPPPLPPPENPESVPHPPPECLPPGSPPSNSPVERQNRKRRHSPTLEDLEAKQQALLEALENSGAQIDTTADDSLMNDILELENENPMTPNGDTQTTTMSSISAESNAQLSDSLRVATPELADIPNRKSSVLGTPVIKFSPYEKLPTGEKFSVGVSDVINFENLPDSTGKYEQMVKVIEKVRLAVKRSNEEN